MSRSEVVIFPQKICGLSKITMNCEVPQFDFQELGRSGDIQGCAQTFFASSFKDLNEMQVFQPCKENVRKEMTIVSNCVATFLALKTGTYQDGVPTILQMKRIICQCLDRVQRCISKSMLLPTENTRAVRLLENMEKVVAAVRDPIAHFRCLDMLTQVTVLLGLTCLFITHQTDRKGVVRRAYSLLNELNDLLCRDIVQSTVPYKNGRFYVECTEGNLPRVSDLIQLTLAPTSDYTREHPITYTHWRWLDDMLNCKKLVFNKEFLLAMGHLEQLLASQLDPKIRSAALCLFAECYIKQESPQLAIQTYKRALQVDSSNLAVLRGLAGVYQQLGQADLEVETLTILLRFLRDNDARGSAPSLDIHYDSLVCSVWKVLPSVGLVDTALHFARRCTALGRHSEAAEQYVSLLRLLEEDINGSTNAFIDVCEVGVEASESLSLAGLTDQCVEIVEKFYTALAAGLAPRTNHTPRRVARGDSRAGLVSPSSLDASFTLFQKSSSDGKCDTSLLAFDDDDDDDDVGKLMGTKKFQDDEDEADICDYNDDDEFEGNSRSVSESRLFDCISGSSRRKRRRPLHSVTEDNDNRDACNGDEREDRWWKASLMVRLLVSKTDALVASRGFHTEESQACLLRAQDILLNSQTRVFESSNPEPHTIPGTSTSPAAKRRRVGSDGEVASIVPQISSCEGNGPSPLWVRSVISVTERLVKGYQGTGDKISAQTSARLLLQLNSYNKVARSVLLK